MKSIHGFVYAHLDSRGGSSFVKADTREEADRKYVEYFWSGEWEDFKDAAEEDFICEANLHFTDDYEYGHNEDLEHDCAGRVISKGLRTLEDWPEWEEDEWQAGEDFMDELMTPGVKDLEHVSKGNQPQLLTEWSWQSWNDDAFSFILILE